CKEVKLLGADADLTKLPIPIHSEGDAGRYLGSGITITKDPDTGIRNEAIIRALVKGPRRMGFWMAARHNWAHLMKYQERGGPAPVFEVTAITRRREPIYRHMQATVFTDHQPLVSVPMEASLYRRLREIHGHTEVHDVYIPPWVTMFTVFVQLTPRWDGQARDVLLGVLSSPYLHPKIAIAVDED